MREEEDDDDEEEEKEEEKKKEIKKKQQEEQEEQEAKEKDGAQKEENGSWGEGQRGTKGKNRNTNAAMALLLPKRFLIAALCSRMPIQ